MHIGSIGLRLGLLMIAMAGGVAPARGGTRVAVIVPLSGPLQPAGREIEATSKAWAASVNARSGEGTVDLMVLDDKSSADGARDAAKSAVTQGASVVMNCFGSVACMAVAQELKASGVPLIGAIAGDERLRTPDMPHVFTTRVGARDEVDIVLKYLQGMSISELLVVFQDDGFGQSYRRALEDVLKARPGVKAVAQLALNPASKDYAAVARQVMEKPSPAVLLLANTPNSIGLIEAMKGAGYRGMYFNLAAQANPLFVERVGRLTADNKLVAAFVTMTPSPTLPTQGVAGYRDAITRHGQGLSPTYLGLESFMNASLAGAVLAKDAKPSAQSLAKLLSTDLRGTDVAGLPVKFDATRRQVLRWVNLSAVTSDGRVRSY